MTGRFRALPLAVSYSRIMPDGASNSAVAGILASHERHAERSLLAGQYPHYIRSHWETFANVDGNNCCG
jgi:hypothetical protein